MPVYGRAVFLIVSLLIESINCALYERVRNIFLRAVLQFSNYNYIQLIGEK